MLSRLGGDSFDRLRRRYAQVLRAVRDLRIGRRVWCRKRAVLIDTMVQWIRRRRRGVRRVEEVHMKATRMAVVTAAAVVASALVLHVAWAQHAEGKPSVTLKRATSSSSRPARFTRRRTSATGRARSWPPISSKRGSRFSPRSVFALRGDQAIRREHAHSRAYGATPA